MSQITQNIKCVIFDCDGVLVDSEKLCCKALVSVFSRYDSQFDLDTCMAHFQGGKVADILNDTIARLDIKIRLDDVEQQYRTQVKSLFEKELQPVKGINEFLTNLKANGVQFCVVSNSQKEKIEHSLDLTGLLPKFEGRVFSAFEANSWKPEPDLLLYAVMIMGYSPNECLYIDDSEKGVIAGIKAGIKTVHFKSNLYNSSVDFNDTLQVRDIAELDLLLR